ncbi:formylglycine-generating enzyme family protein, partial [Hyella patelloides]|uniref:formylglycine-generating enzyme family protein n=1 Tax=Hyella patelloides TaxID=1982969 RepID=UPI0011A42F62
MGEYTNNFAWVLEKEFTHPQLKSFANRFGKAHLDLACHAAFPLALTPELLYCLRENFPPKVKDKAPWIAVNDILLFLCDPVGFELYEFQPEVRHELLVILKQNFGEKRLRELSDFMVTYISEKLKTNYRADEDLGAAPHWTALAYVKPEEAVNKIAEKLKEALEKQNSNDLVRLTPYLETYADVDPLIEAGFEPLLVLSRGWEAQAQGDTEEAEEKFAQLRQEHGEYLQIGEVQFKIPQPEDDNLQIFEFETVTVNRRGEIIQRESKQARYFTENLGNGVTLDMVAIPRGRFMMGSPEGEGSDNEKPQHEVSVPSFFMGKYPVTQAQWREIASLPKVERNLKPDPSEFKGDKLPVETVSWYDAVEFCQRLSRQTGKEYRLPSEAEWEYACRSVISDQLSVTSGELTVEEWNEKYNQPFHFGETITSELANYNTKETYADEPKGKRRGETTLVGQFPPNAFGLYDMHGNVWEWCADEWHDNYEGAPTDGSAWIDDNEEENVNTENESYSSKNDKNFVYSPLRGGSWLNHPVDCRSASRLTFYRRVYHNLNNGFR